MYSEEVMVNDWDKASAQQTAEVMSEAKKKFLKLSKKEQQQYLQENPAGSRTGNAVRELAWVNNIDDFSDKQKELIAWATKKVTPAKAKFVAITKKIWWKTSSTTAEPEKKVEVTDTKVAQETKPVVAEIPKSWTQEEKPTNNIIDTINKNNQVMSKNIQLWYEWKAINVDDIEERQKKVNDEINSASERKANKMRQDMQNYFKKRWIVNKSKKQLDEEEMNKQRQQFISKYNK